MDRFIDALPICPFIHLQNLPINSEFLSFMAWFIPFPQIIALLQTWVAAVAVWYVVKIGMRWAKAIR
jgi:hypothetical protein